MRDKPPTPEIPDNLFNGADYDTPHETSTTEDEKIKRLIASSIEYARTHDLSGEKIEPKISQENTKGGKLTETVSKDFKEFVDSHVIGLLMTPIWSQTTRGLTNIPDEKETEKFSNDIINEARSILRSIFTESPLRDAQRKYIMDELYKKLKEQNLTEPFKKSLKRFFEGVFYFLPTDFNADEK